MNLSHKTTKYNKYLLPIKYTEDSLNRKEIFFTETQIRLLKNNGELIKSIVITSKKIVDSCYGLDFQITQYGVLFLNKDDIEINNNKLILNYSFSIPFTDLGKAIKFSFDLVTFKEQVFIDP